MDEGMVFADEGAPVKVGRARRAGAAVRKVAARARVRRRSLAVAACEVSGVVEVVRATWAWSPIAGRYALGVALLAAAWLGEGRA